MQATAVAVTPYKFVRPPERAPLIYAGQETTNAIECCVWW